MKTFTLFIFACLLSFELFAQNITFSSSEIGAKVRTYLNLDSTDNVTKTIADTITVFDCYGCGITDISDLLNFPNIEILNLSGNSIVDLSPIASLPHLKYVNLSGNNIEEVYQLALSDAPEYTVDLGKNRIKSFTDIYNSSLTLLTIIGDNLQDTTGNYDKIHLNSLSAKIDSIGQITISYDGWTNTGNTGTLYFGDGDSSVAILDGFTHSISHTYPLLDSYYGTRIADFFLTLTCKNKSLYYRLRRPIYVNINATGNNNGTSWKNAYICLDSAVNFYGDIWIAKGTYSPSAFGKPFTIESGTNIYGGFLGNETSIQERDLINNKTILSGKIAQNGNIFEFTGQVLFIKDIAPPVPISSGGATTDNGTQQEAGSGGDEQYNGEIIVGEVIEEEPSFSFNVIIDGLMFQDAIAGRENDGALCAFNQYGGYLNLLVKNCEFFDNNKMTNNGKTNLVNCSSIDSIVFEHCNFNKSNNLSLLIDSSKVAFTKCRFYNNANLISATQCEIKMQNSAIYSNTSIGSLFNISSSNVTFINNTLTNNISNKIIKGDSSTINIYNTIFADGLTTNLTNSTINLANCLIKGGYYIGTNTINATPAFINTAGIDGKNGSADDDFSLENCSPSINAGDTTVLLNESNDLNGNPRIVGNSIDIGAFENKDSVVSVTPIIAIKNDTLYSSIKNNNLWFYNNSIITSSNTNYLKPIDEGIYYVINTTCSSTKSNEYKYTISYINEQDINSISCYPNPVNNILIINSKDNSQIINRIEIYSISGIKLKEYGSLNSNSVQIDATSLSPNLYIFKVFIDKEILSFKVLKK